MFNNSLKVKTKNLIPQPKIKKIKSKIEETNSIKQEIKNPLIKRQFGKEITKNNSNIQTTKSHRERNKLHSFSGFENENVKYFCLINTNIVSFLY